MKFKSFSVAVFAGDGIGTEIMKEALKILSLLSDKRNIGISLTEGQIGGAAIDLFGKPLPDSSLNLARQCDALLLGAVGGPKWEDLEYSLRPERALIRLRQELDLFANLRPIVPLEEVLAASSLKENIVKSVDIMMVRELTGDVYFGKPRGITRDITGKRTGINTMIYTDAEIERVAICAFEMARKRKKNLVSVDKANVLECSELWREVVNEVGLRYPDVFLRHMYVDNCAMQLVRNPAQFDVIVTGNLFGDILSDEAAVLAGSIGMLPSASLGKEKALYEPISGSAPDIAGQNKANPIGMILSVALLFRHSLAMIEEARLLEKAVLQALQDGYRTQDIYTPQKKLVGTEEMGNQIWKQLDNLLKEAK